MARCWLCENCTAEEVKHFHGFIVEKAHSVDAKEMARHMHEHIASSFAGGEGLPSTEDVLLHIQKHVLHPTVRVAQILRNLLGLAEMLQEMVVGRGEDGSPLIDVRTVTVYLKVVAEIMQIYKTSDISKMLFSGVEP
jgi:hypothetical protein